MRKALCDLDAYVKNDGYFPIITFLIGPQTQSACMIDVQHNDFILMCATVSNGSAERNLLIPILATALGDAGEEDPLTVILERVKQEMKIRRPCQNPELRSTTTKLLSLKLQSPSINSSSRLD